MHRSRFGRGTAPIYFRWFVCSRKWRLSIFVSWQMPSQARIRTTENLFLKSYFRCRTMQPTVDSWNDRYESLNSDQGCHAGCIAYVSEVSRQTCASRRKYEDTTENYYSARIRPTWNRFWKHVSLGMMHEEITSLEKIRLVSTNDPVNLNSYLCRGYRRRVSGTFL